MLEYSGCATSRSIVWSVGTMYTPSSFIRLAVCSWRIVPCSIERTPFAIATSIAGDVWQWARTYVCQPAATSTAAAISPAENWTLSNGSVGETIAPEASSLICVAPRRSCSRTARRTSSGPSTISWIAIRPGTAWPWWTAWWAARSSPWPPVWDRTDPDGRIRGPRPRPFSTAFAHAGSRPPASRTVVKPSSRAPSMYSATRRTWSISGSSPWSPFWPMSAKWTWASVRPGMSVVPAPSISRAPRTVAPAACRRIEAIVPSRTTMSCRPYGSRRVQSRTATSRMTRSRRGSGVALVVEVIGTSCRVRRGAAAPTRPPPRGGGARPRPPGFGPVSGQRPPALAEQDREREQDGADRDERDADLDHLVTHDQVRRELLEDVVELLRALGRVVLAAGRVGDRGERVLVDRPPETAAGPAEAAAAEGA